MDPFGALDRWMYRGARPNRVARWLNGLLARAAAAGMGPQRQVMVEVVGRRSGKPVRFPLTLAVLDGERYAVSMLGPDVNWVRNVRAAGGRAELRHGEAEAVLFTEVDQAQRPPLLRGYLKSTPGARAHIRVSPSAPLDEFARIAADHPVFRVTRRPDGNTGATNGGTA